MRSDEVGIVRSNLFLASRLLKNSWSFTKRRCISVDTLFKRRQITYGTLVSTTFTDDTTIAALRPTATSPDDRSVVYSYDAMDRLVRQSVSSGIVTTIPTTSWVT